MSRSRSQRSARFRPSSESSKARELRGVDRADGLEPQTQLSSTRAQVMAPTRRRRRSISRDRMSPGTRAGIHRSCGTTTSISPQPKSPPGRPGSCCPGQCERREPVNNHSSASFRNDHSDVIRDRAADREQVSSSRGCRVSTSDRRPVWTGRRTALWTRATPCFAALASANPNIMVDQPNTIGA